MARTLSSAKTFVMKVVFPILWICSFGYGTLGLFNVGTAFSDKADAPPPPEMKWLFLAGWLFGSAIIYFTCIRLKRVRMDEASLYISNYLEEVEVPLRDVGAVRENRWVNGHPITIELRRHIQFGDRIVFMPKSRWFAFWSSHPVVAEIQQAVDRALGAEAGAGALRPR